MWTLKSSQHKQWPKIIKTIRLKKSCLEKNMKNGMSSLGGFSRFFETAWCSAWPSAPQKIKNKYFELLLIHLWFFINDFYFLEFFKNLFLFAALHQAVRAVSKKRPKCPKLDIPFKNKIEKRARTCSLERMSVSVLAQASPR
jgi:hypothetical protein